MHRQPFPPPLPRTVRAVSGASPDRTQHGKDRRSPADPRMEGSVSAAGLLPFPLPSLGGSPASSGAEGGHPPRGEQRRRRSEEHTSELQSRENLVCRLLLEKKKKNERDTASRNN